MWFDELMDFCKKGVKAANENKGIFVPIFLKLLIGLILSIPIAIFSTIFLIGFREKIAGIANGSQSILSIAVPLLIIATIIIILYTALKSLVQVGTVNMYKSAIDGIKPTVSTFFEGINKYFIRVWGINVLICLFYLFLFIPLIALAILYSLTIGILTAGWGIVFGVTIISVYFSTWVIAIVIDEKSIFDGLQASINLGKKYFWGLFLLILSASMISKYIISAFGWIIVIFGGWFLSAVIMTYSSMILVAIYKEKREV